jgi:hypothetical protein
LTEGYHIIRDKPVFSPERRLHKDYDLKGAVEKIFGCESQEVRGQDELIGVKPQAIK